MNSLPLDNQFDQTFCLSSFVIEFAIVGGAEPCNDGRH